MSTGTLGPTEIEDANKVSEQEMSKAKKIAGGVAIAGLLGLIAYIISTGGGIDVAEILKQAVDKIESLGPYGFLYFAAV